MHRDDEADLRAAFAELQHREREQAPPFEAMRESAARRAFSATPARNVAPVVRQIAWTAAVLCCAATGWWLANRTEPGPEAPIQARSVEQVDELIAAIERHLEDEEPTSLFGYPTDVLLADNQVGFAP